MSTDLISYEKKDAILEEGESTGGREGIVVVEEAKEENAPPPDRRPKRSVHGAVPNYASIRIHLSPGQNTSLSIDAIHFDDVADEEKRPPSGRSKRTVRMDPSRARRKKSDELDNYNHDDDDDDDDGGNDNELDSENDNDDEDDDDELDDGDDDGDEDASDCTEKQKRKKKDRVYKSKRPKPTRRIKPPDRWSSLSLLSSPHRNNSKKGGSKSSKPKRSASETNAFVTKDHFKSLSEGDTKYVQCIYCAKRFQGGVTGTSTAHLVDPCPSAPEHVRLGAYLAKCETNKSVAECGIKRGLDKLRAKQTPSSSCAAKHDPKKKSNRLKHEENAKPDVSKRKYSSKMKLPMANKRSRVASNNADGEFNPQAINAIDSMNSETTTSEKESESLVQTPQVTRQSENSLSNASQANDLQTAVGTTSTGATRTGATAITTTTHPQEDLIAQVEHEMDQLRDEIIKEDEQNLVTETTFCMLQQFIPYIVQEGRGHMTVGQMILCCRHCLNYRSFNSVHNGLKSFHHFSEHFAKCRLCPAAIRRKLADARGRCKQDAKRRVLVERMFERMDAMDKDNIVRIQNKRHHIISNGVAAMESNTPKKSVHKAPQRPTTVLPKQIDPHAHEYREETAFMFYEPPFLEDNIPGEEAVEEMQSLPPPRPFPNEDCLPQSTVKWSLHPAQRVVLADFSHVDDVSKVDLEFLGQMMDRDDVTVISEGLFVPACNEAYSLENIKNGVGLGYKRHHKFRRYIFDGKEYKEQPGMLAMEIADFYKYLLKRQAAMENRPENVLIHSIDQIIDEGGLPAGCESFTTKECDSSGQSCRDGKDNVENTEVTASFSASIMEQRDSSGELCSHNENRVADSSSVTSFPFKRTEKSPVESLSPTMEENTGSTIVCVAAAEKQEDKNSGEQFESLDDSIDNQLAARIVDENEKAESPPVRPADTICASRRDGSLVDIDPSRDVLYMLDLDITRNLPGLETTLFRNFKIPHILPGGLWCSLFHVPRTARNFMGPNLYVCPPGGFTHFHQDGYGCVDSGHLVLGGFNEVVMLRRLPHRHRKQVEKDLQEIEKEFKPTTSLPHWDGKKPSWPTNETIRKWEERNYCPSIFILKPGQHVHINKGRMHAFRKLGTEVLPAEDCHYNARAKVVKEQNMGKVADVCVSIAWDWQYRGFTPHGIHRETTSMLESQYLVELRDPPVQSLATTRLSLLAMGRHLDLAQHSNMAVTVDSAHLLARGIGPVLKHILKRQLETLKLVEELATCQLPVLNACVINEESDQERDPESYKIDPDGNDYVCEFCGAELENLYFHCFGCEKILNKDFNFCGACFLKKKHSDHRQIVQEERSQQSWASNVNHIGSREEQPREKCPQCKGKAGKGKFPHALQPSSRFSTPSLTSTQLLAISQPTTHPLSESELHGYNCSLCNQCLECSCICHTCCSVHFRHLNKKSLKLMLKDVESLKPIDDLQCYTRARLEAARDRTGEGLIQKTKALEQFLGEGFKPACDTAKIKSIQPLSCGKGKETNTDSGMSEVSREPQSSESQCGIDPVSVEQGYQEEGKASGAHVAATIHAEGGLVQVLNDELSVTEKIAEQNDTEMFDAEQGIRNAVPLISGEATMEYVNHYPESNLSEEDKGGALISITKQGSRSGWNVDGDEEMYSSPSFVPSDKSQLFINSISL